MFSPNKELWGLEPGPCSTKSGFSPLNQPLIGLYRPCCVGLRFTSDWTLFYQMELFSPVEIFRISRFTLHFIDNLLFKSFILMEYVVHLCW